MGRPREHMVLTLTLREIAPFPGEVGQLPWATGFSAAVTESGPHPPGSG